MVAGAWGGYQNGEIPLSALIPVGNGQFLRVDVARSLEALLSAYMAETGAGRPVVVSGYRSRAAQQWELDHPRGQAIAAVGESTHGWAITVDLDGTGRNPLTRFSRWLDLHAMRFGFRRTVWSESWHYQGAFVAIAPAAEDVKPILNIEVKDEEMIRIQSTARGIALIGPGYFRHLTTNEEVEASTALVSKTLVGNDRQFDLWRSLAIGGQSSPVAS